LGALVHMLTLGEEQPDPERVDIQLGKPASRRQWTDEEDRVLVDAVKREGAHNWAVIAQALTGRKDKQCRERWFNHLCPNVKKGDWTVDEDEVILKGVSEFGTVRARE
jgi:hypothetical protein